MSTVREVTWFLDDDHFWLWVVMIFVLVFMMRSCENERQNQHEIEMYKLQHPMVPAKEEAA